MWDTRNMVIYKNNHEMTALSAPIRNTRAGLQPWTAMPAQLLGCFKWLYLTMFIPMPRLRSTVERRLLM